MQLEENSLVPLYAQVMSDLRAAIESGKYAVGEKIPSESELSEMYSVSRITIRRAIEELSNSGYLTKKQGKGTYVNPPKLENKLLQTGELQSFAGLCEEAGRVAGAHLLDRWHVSATPELAEALHVKENSDLIVIRRVRTADGVPIVLETSTFPYDEYSFVEELSGENTSMFALLAERDCRAAERMDNALLEMVRADAKTAEALSVGIGEPLFSEDGVFVDEHDEPVFFGQLRIVASEYCFRI